jgi:hypothetical protein
MRRRKPSGRPEGYARLQFVVQTMVRLATGRSPTFSVKARLVAGLGRGSKSPGCGNDYTFVSGMPNTAKKLIAPAAAM